MDIADFVFLPCVVIMVICSVHFSSRIKGSRMAMQWDRNGHPTWHAPKLLGLWALVGLAIAGRTLIWFLLAYYPDTLHGTTLGLTIFSLTLAASHVVTVRAATRSPEL
jgi:hypothetical protein